MLIDRACTGLLVSLAAIPLAAQPVQPPAAPPAAPPPSNFRQAQGAVASRPTLTGAGARRMIDAAVAVAVKNGWTASIAVVDAGGNLLAFQRLDGATLGTIDVARRKATTALTFGMPSSAVGAMVQRGGAAMLTLGREMVAVTGGAPLMQDGQLIGAIGISGGFRGEDDKLVEAALAAPRS